MKTLGMMLAEQILMNEAIKTITPKASSNKSLLVTIDLANLEEDTLSSIWNDVHVDWTKLDKTELKKLHSLLDSDLSFDEWIEENGF